MNYAVEITIARKRDRVIALFEDPENMQHWMEGFERYEHLSGEPGQAGSKTRLIFEQGSRVTEMTETIERNDLPDEFVAVYETNRGVWNRVVNHFHVDRAGQTRWVAEHEFKFGPLMTILAFFMRGSFRKSTRRYMRLFKEFAERERDS